MSAASKTNPGGYVVDPQALEQFEVSDERDMETIKNQIRKMGLFSSDERLGEQLCRYSTLNT
ncbi:thiamine biosynthesis protein ThiH [Sphingobacterium multivorum]|uniref:Thiamine biosynthesis protein ThiH n=2 Tax=Sphingobacterium multivorum TaxID=28454 RepID=A0A2X2JJC2_SPHMU|nr:thiamine biosynthesis protein ThiH [Sphingobacterium multivorum]